MMNEGARWFRLSSVEGWALIAGYAEPAGIVLHDRGLAWSAHLVRSGVMHTGVSFENAVAIVEQAATNVLDEAAAAPIL